MDKIVLLTELRAMANDVPDFKSYTPSSRVHLEWLGKIHALIAQWDHHEAVSVRSNADFLHSNLFRDGSVANILGALHRAIAHLELQVPAQPTQAFGPGAVYDFHKNLRELLASAMKSIFVVDPYLDTEIFDVYITEVSPKVAVRLLARQNPSTLKHALEKFIAQFKMSVEIRISSAIHDRVVFIDDRSCWVLGQSIKDAAKSKPTYIAPLPIDVTQFKKIDYERIWVSASIL